MLCRSIVGSLAFASAAAASARWILTTGRGAVRAASLPAACTTGA